MNKQGNVWTKTTPSMNFSTDLGKTGLVGPIFPQSGTAGQPAETKRCQSMKYFLASQKPSIK